jgi:hypothetical protein
VYVDSDVLRNHSRVKGGDFVSFRSHSRARLQPEI